jgi:hypothetical protein
MTRTIVRAAVLALVEGDERFYERLCAEGLLPRDEAALDEAHLELARVAHTLVHELELNWAGVEVVLRMRGELIDARRQVADLLALLASARLR